MTSSRARLGRALGAVALLPAVLTPAFLTGTAHAAAPVTCQGRTATVVGTSGDDHLRGTAGADVIAGLAGDDVIRGRRGDDLICGGGHSDHLYGGGGSDRLVDVRGVHSVELGGAGDDHLVTRTKSSTLVGGPGSDRLTSSAFKDLFLRSEPGDDRVVVRRAVQIQLDLMRSPVGVHLDLARGVLTGRGHTTFTVATGSTFNVQGSQYDDVLDGGPWGDSLAGVGGNDQIAGHGGRDALTGGSGRNVMRGGGGRDWLADSELGQGRDVAYAGPGDDFLRFSSNDVVVGGPGADLVHVHFKVGAHGSVDGGSGSNRLIAALVPRPSGSPWKHALVDLRSRRLVVDGHILGFRGVFHWLDVKPGSARHWTLGGTSRADVLDSYRPRQRFPFVVHARGGADTIGGGGGDDVIWGGAGHDTVDAFRGSNTCHSVESDPSSTCTVSKP